MKIIIHTFILIISMSFASFSLSAKTYDFTDNNSIRLLQSAADGAELKLDLIRKAKHHIHIMSYYLDNSKFPSEVFKELKKAHDRGVEVRILTTFIPTFAKDLKLKTKDNLRVNDGGSTFLYLLLGIKGNVSILNNLHEKIFLVDGKKAIIGGRNLSDSSFRAKDLEVLIEGPMVNQLQTHFLKILNVLLEREKTKHCKFDSELASDCYENYDSQSFLASDSNFFPTHQVVGNVTGRLISHDAVLERIEKKLNRKERREMNDDVINAVVNTKFQSMRAYNYYILPTEKYKHFIFSSHAENKDIKFITNSLKTSAIVSNKGYLYSLPIINDMVKSGIEIYQWQGPENYEYLHEKVIIFDEEHIFLGSHNFGTGSTTMSNEITIEFYSKEIGRELTLIFDEEIGNPEKTKQATNNNLAREISENMKTINFLRKTVFGKILEETY